MILLLVFILIPVIVLGYIIFLVVYFCSLDNDQKNVPPGNITTGNISPGNVSPEYASAEQASLAYEYTESRVSAIKYIRVTFRDWNHNMKCEDITFTLGEPRQADNKCVYMLDSILFTQSNLEIFSVVFLDANQNLLPSTDYGYEFEPIPEGGFANLYIWLSAR